MCHYTHGGSLPEALSLEGSLPWRFTPLDGHTLGCWVVVVALRISHRVIWIEVRVSE